MVGIRVELNALSLPGCSWHRDPVSAVLSGAPPPFAGGDDTALRIFVVLATSLLTLVSLAS